MYRIRHAICVGPVACLLGDFRHFPTLPHPGLRLELPCADFWYPCRWRSMHLGCDADRVSSGIMRGRGRAKAGRMSCPWEPRSWVFACAEFSVAMTSCCIFAINLRWLFRRGFYLAGECRAWLNVAAGAEPAAIALAPPQAASSSLRVMRFLHCLMSWAKITCAPPAPRGDRNGRRCGVTGLRNALISGADDHRPAISRFCWRGPIIIWTSCCYCASDGWCFNLSRRRILNRGLKVCVMRWCFRLFWELPVDSGPMPAVDPGLRAARMNRNRSSARCLHPSFLLSAVVCLLVLVRRFPHGDDIRTNARRGRGAPSGDRSLWPRYPKHDYGPRGAAPDLVSGGAGGCGDRNGALACRVGLWRRPTPPVTGG